MIGRRFKTPASEADKPKGFDDFELRLGDLMRGERATLGKSLLDIQRELKIKATFIAAIENADVSAFETPGFIAGKETEYRARIERMIARADIVKLSDEDLHWLEGAGDLTALARGILAKGPKVVFITEGADGARAVTARQDRFVAAQKVTVVDTVGAGDTFNAGVLAALHQAGALSKARLDVVSDAELDAALSLGTRAAAITVSRAGANPPWANEL